MANVDLASLKHELGETNNYMKKNNKYKIIYRWFTPESLCVYSSRAIYYFYFREKP